MTRQVALKGALQPWPPPGDTTGGTQGVITAVASTQVTRQVALKVALQPWPPQVTQQVALKVLENRHFHTTNMSRLTTYWRCFR